MKASKERDHTTSRSGVTSRIFLPCEFTIRVLPLGKRWHMPRLSLRNGTPLPCGYDQGKAWVWGHTPYARASGRAEVVKDQQMPVIQKLCIVLASPGAFCRPDHRTGFRVHDREGIDIAQGDEICPALNCGKRGASRRVNTFT